MSTTLKTIHDQLLQLQPEGASHDVTTCPICTGEVELASETIPGGSVSEKTYTEDEHNAVLAKVTDLEAKVAELSAVTEASAIDGKVAAAKAELETKITDLQSQLDAAVLEAQTAKDQHAALIQEREDEATAAAEAIALAARRDERVAAVKEVASFPEEYLNANADRFAAMSDEAFTAAVEDWKAIAAKAPETKVAQTEIPATTAMVASRTETTGETNPLTEVFGLRFQGVDTRTV